VTPWLAAGPLEGELLRGALVGGAYLLLFAAVEMWYRTGRPPVEWTRKAAHVGGGLIAASFPWVLTSHWTVLALGAAFALILWGTRRMGWLRGIHGVARKSEGGLYFPLAIYLLFLFGAGHAVFYLVAILTLVVADAMAALLGGSYGRTTYQVETDRRSIEGSVAFFVATFLCVHLPLLLLTELPREGTVVVALQVALIVTLLEAVSLRGNDNLIVPLVTFLLLFKMTPHEPSFILWQLVSQLLIIALVFLVAYRSHLLTFSGGIAATLFFYGAFSLGGPEWTIFPAVALLVFLLFHRRARKPTGPANPRYQVRAVFYATLGAVALYVANNAFETWLPVVPALHRGDPFYPLFVGALAAHLGMLVYVWLEAGRHDRIRPRLALRACALSLGVIPLGILVMQGGGWSDALPAAALVLLALPAYLALRQRDGWERTGIWDMRRQALATGAALLLLLPLRLAQVGAW
jgi:dolichol kinase